MRQGGGKCENSHIEFCLGWKVMSVCSLWEMFWFSEGTVKSGFGGWKRFLAYPCSPWKENRCTLNTRSSKRSFFNFEAGSGLRWLRREYAEGTWKSGDYEFLAWSTTISNRKAYFCNGKSMYLSTFDGSAILQPVDTVGRLCHDLLRGFNTIPGGFLTINSITSGSSIANPVVGGTRSPRNWGPPDMSSSSCTAISHCSPFSHAKSKLPWWHHETRDPGLLR